MGTMESITEKVDVGLVELARSYLPVDDNDRLVDTELRARISQHLMNDEAMALLNERMFYQHKAGKADPRLPMLVKHLGTSELQRKDELILRILGTDGLSWDSTQTDESVHRMVRNWAYDKAHTIAGGTSEIQLNIIAKRGLGLPD